VDVEHLDDGELVEHGPRGEAGRQRLELSAQRDVKAIGQEGDEDVRFDAVLKLVVDRVWRSLSRLSAKLKVAASGATSTSIKRHAALALARAAPSFMSSSSRVSSIAAICLRRAHSHLSLRRRMARSLWMRAWLCAST
jgi:hypothetical protein